MTKGSKYWVSNAATIQKLKHENARLRKENEDLKKQLALAREQVGASRSFWKDREDLGF